MLLLCKTAFCAIKERETYRKGGGGVAGALWKLWEFSRVGGAGEHYCMCFSAPELHGWELYPRALAYLQGHRSVFPDTLLDLTSALNLGNK